MIPLKLRVSIAGEDQFLFSVFAGFSVTKIEKKKATNRHVLLGLVREMEMHPLALISPSSYPFRRCIFLYMKCKLCGW